MVTTQTLLTLTGIGIAPFSARGLTENLEPLDLGQLRRTVNGVLTDLTDADLHRKFRVSISGGDMRPKVLDGVWKGTAVTVGCVSELGRAITIAAGAGSVAIGREAVTGSGSAVLGSTYATQSITTGVTFSQASSGIWSATVNFGDASLAGTGYVWYRPTLQCLVTRWNSDIDEWAGRPGWTLELEEV